MTYILKLKFYTRYNLPKEIVNEVIIEITIFLKKIQIFFEISQKLTH